MLARQIFFAFIFLYVFIELKNYFFFFFFLFFWLFWEYFFGFPPLQKAKIRYFTILAFGIFLGIVLTFFRLSFSPQKEPRDIISGNGEILQLSRKSIVLLWENKKIRLILDSENLNLKKGDEINFSCEVLKKEVPILEKLQQIHFSCIALANVKITKEKSSYLKKLREKLEKILLDNLGKESLALGIVFSETHDIDEFSLFLFRNMGVAHLFAASGLHLGMLFALFFFSFKILRLANLGYLVATLASLGFLLLLDVPISLLRAFIFLVIYLIKKFSDEKLSHETVVFLTAVITEILIPYSSFTVSFILSFGVTSAIFLFFEPIKKLLPNFGFFSFIKDHLALTLSTFGGANFLSILLFQKTNPLSLIYNFLAVPPTAFYLGSVLIGFFIPPVFTFTQILDAFYKKLGEWHFIFFTQNFYPPEYIHELIWSFLLLIFFLGVFWLYFRKRFLYAKKYFWKLLALIFFIYGAILFYAQKNPLNQVKAIPYMVVEYRDKNITLIGEKATFIEEDPLKTSDFFQFPVKNIQIETKSKIDLPKIIPAIVRNKAQEYAPLGLLKSNQACYVFFSKMKPEYWPKDVLKNCPELFLILSKKDREKNYNLKPIFSHFGYTKEEKILSYFMWQRLN